MDPYTLYTSVAMKPIGSKNFPSPRSPVWTAGWFAAVILLLLLNLAAPVFAMRLINVELLFEINENLMAPSDVAVSDDGRIYIVDGTQNAIRVFGPNGEPLFSFGIGGGGNGQFNLPLGIDIDDSGKVYIADSGNHRIQIFTSEGGFLESINLPAKDNSPADPTDLAVDDRRNRCYIVDNDNHSIFAYDLSTHELLNIYGSPGAGKLQFRYPFFMALDSEQYLYVVDVINTRVQVMNPEGLFVGFIGAWGVEKGMFYRPKGVAIDSRKRVFVSDSYLGVIQVFDSLGNFYAVVGGSEKKGVKKFRTPTGISIDSRNRLYVVEMFANKVGVYRILGERQVDGS